MKLQTRQARRFWRPVFLVLMTAMLSSSLAQNPDPAIPKTIPTGEVRQSVCLNGMWDFTPTGQSPTQILVPSTWQRTSATRGPGAVEHTAAA